jgi:hypothetical protein
LPIETFTYTDGLRRKVTHWVRVYENAAWTTVIVTDRSSTYICPSITNSIEDFANAFLDYHLNISPHRVVFIEHYDERPEEFDLVRFAGKVNGRLHTPEWKRITKAQAEEWAGAVIRSYAEEEAL